MSPSREYYDERLSELEAEKDALEEKLASTELRVKELEGELRVANAQMERMARRDAHHQALLGAQVSNAVNAFHSHLDGCEQCRNHPFDLCSDGAQLL